MKLTTSPHLLRLRIRVLPSSEMSLHIAIEIRHDFIEQLIVVYSVIPSLAVGPEALSCSADDDAAVRTRDQVVKVAIVKSKGVCVDEVWCILSLWTCDMATNATDWRNAPSVFGQELGRETVGGIDDLG